MLVLLFALWLLLNMRVTWDVCLVGAVVAGLIFAFTCVFLGHSPAKEKRLYRNTGLLCLYVLTLIWEVLKANAKVLRIIWDKRVPVHQAMVEIQVDLKSEMTRTLLANAITLTPGTITVLAEGSSFTVHCLSREMIDGIETSRFVRLLQKMEA